MGFKSHNDFVDSLSPLSVKFEEDLYERLKHKVVYDTNEWVRNCIHDKVQKVRNKDQNIVAKVEKIRLM